MVFACLKAGFEQVWENKRILLIFYLLNLLMGVVLMLPFRATLSHHIGNSLAGEELGGTIDMDLLLEFIVKNGALGGIIIGTGLAVLGVCALGNLFLSGGAFGIFASGDTYNASRFWGNAGKYFGRFLRLFLWGVPILIILFSLQFIVTGTETIFWGSDPYEYIPYWGKWLKWGLRVFALFMFFVIFDYGRIYTIKLDERNMKKAILAGLRFTWKNLRRTVTLAFTFSLLGIIALLIYNPVADLLSAPNTVIVILLFLWQQSFILFRMMLRLGLYSAQVHLYNELSGQAVPAATPEDIPISREPEKDMVP